MKKTIAILLVAILAVSSVFAAFSGEASLGFGGNLDNGNFGFIDSAAKVKFDFDLATASAESIAEGDVYASIKGTFGLKLTNGEKTQAAGDLYEGPWSLGIIADITEAKVAGENWYVSILGIADAPNYAESAIDTYTVEDTYDKYGLPKADYDKAYSYGVGFEKAPGVEVSVYDYKVGFGLLGDYDDDDNWKLEDNLKLSVFAETPEYDFGGLTAQFGTVYSYSAFDKLDKGAVVKYTTDPDKARNAIGVSAKVGFANDTLSASVATDMGFNLAEKKAKDVFDMDIAANFNWSFLTLDAYYATEAKSGETQKTEEYSYAGIRNGALAVVTEDRIVPGKTDSTYKENVLSFQAKFDLNTFDVPVAITASVKDVLKTVELGVKAEVTAVENLKITANAGYVVNTVDAYDKDFNKDNKDVFLGQWKLGADVEYDFGFAKLAAGVSAKNIGCKAAFDDMAKLSDDVVKAYREDFTAAQNEKELKKAINSYVNNVILGLSASISTESIIPGAELKLAWENANDLLEIYKYNADAEKYNFGKITASCKIAF